MKKDNLYYYQKLSKSISEWDTPQHFIGGLKEALADGYDINFASPSNYLSLLQILIVRATKVNIQGFKRQLDALIQAEADFEQKDGAGWNALIYATTNLFFPMEFYQTIIDHTKNINAEDVNGWNALCFICRVYCDTNKAYYIQYREPQLQKIRLLLLNNIDTIQAEKMLRTIIEKTRYRQEKKESAQELLNTIKLFKEQKKQLTPIVEDTIFDYEL